MRLNNSFATQAGAELAIAVGPVTGCSSGDCVNGADATVLSAVDIGQEVETCKLACPVGETYPVCIGTCLATDTGLSTSCSTCFGVYENCVETNCSAARVVMGSDDCKACKQTSCNPAFLTCGGFNLLPYP